MDAAPQSSPDPPPATGSGRKFTRRNRFVAVVAVGALAGVGYGGWRLYEDHETQVAARQALAAAQQYVMTLTNFDAVHPDPADEKDMDYLLDGATGEYKDMYAKSQDKLLRLQVEKQATGRGNIVDSAIKSASKDKVVVVLLADQAVTNTDNPDPLMDRSRLRVTMHKVDGQWRVGYLEAL